MWLKCNYASILSQKGNNILQKTSISGSLNAADRNINIRIVIFIYKEKKIVMPLKYQFTIPIKTKSENDPFSSKKKIRYVCIHINLHFNCFN